MAAEAFIQCRVAPATKAALRAVADRQQITESALLKRMLALVLSTAGMADAGDVSAAIRPARQARLYVRLTAGDRQLLQERAAARCLPPYAASRFAGTRRLGEFGDGEALCALLCGAFGSVCGSPVRVASCGECA